MEKPNRMWFAEIMLYLSSGLGLLEIFTSATLKGGYTTLYEFDIAAYVVLIAMTYITGRGLNIARYLYVVLALIWLGMQVTLPMYGHSLNLLLLFVQILLTATGIVLFFNGKVNRWFASKAVNRTDT